MTARIETANSLVETKPKPLKQNACHISLFHQFPSTPYAIYRELSAVGSHSSMLKNSALQSTSTSPINVIVFIIEWFISIYFLVFIYLTHLTPFMIPNLLKLGAELARFLLPDRCVLERHVLPQLGPLQTIVDPPFRRDGAFDGPLTHVP